MIGLDTTNEPIVSLSKSEKDLILQLTEISLNDSDLAIHYHSIIMQSLKDSEHPYTDYFFMLASQLKNEQIQSVWQEIAVSIQTKLIGD